MLRRGLALAAVAGVLAGAGGRAHAAGAWIASGTLTPLEQRVAIAAGPSRTTLWTSLRFSGSGGKLAIIVPAPPGTALDFSSDAWFEALEVATAPRLFPPAGVDPFCPGKSGSPNIFQLDGLVGHIASLEAQEITVLDSADKVIIWATQAGMSISPGLAASLKDESGVEFVVMRFNAPQGTGLTPTLRLAMPSAPARLPLRLTRAGSEDLRVTTWVIGPGRGDLIGAAEVVITPSSLAWNAKKGESDIDEQRAAALADDPTRFLVEAAGHPILSTTTSIASGTATIDSVVSTFFERAAAYGDGNFDAAACLDVAEPALESTSPVATSCPHAAVGVIDPATNCTEAPVAGQINPSALRCGPGADDLAVALSNLEPKDVWVTRNALVIPSAGSGNDWPVGFTSGAAVSPVIHVGSVDYEDCNPDGGVPDGGSSSSSSGSSSSGSSGSSGVIVHDYGTDPDVGVGVDVDWEEVIDTTVDAACSCTGPETYGTDYPDDASCNADASDVDTGGCSGDGAEAEGCDGDAADTEGCSGDGIDSESCSSGGGGDSCSGSDFGDGCSGGGSSGCSGADFDCATARARRPHRPKFSILLVSALAILAPLRRLGRRTRADVKPPGSPRSAARR